MIEEFLGVFKKEGSANPQRYLADLGVKYQSLHCGLKPPTLSKAYFEDGQCILV